MVQQFNVLRCFSCKRFQVHQVKKAKQWVCKVCGEKQTMAKTYGQGSAPDCRRHVQKLNMLQGEREQLIAEKIVDDDEEYDSQDENILDAEESLLSTSCSRSNQVESKWEKFIEVEDKDEENLEEQLWHGKPVTMDKTAFEGEKKKGKQPRKFKKNNEKSEEFPPATKRIRTEDFWNEEDKTDQNQLSKRHEDLPIMEKKWKKSSSKWEIFHSNTKERIYSENVVSNERNSILSNSNSDWGKFDKNRKEAKNPDLPIKQDSVGIGEFHEQNFCNSIQGPTFSNKKSSSKTAQSKWSKFLGPSCTQTEVESDDDIDDSNLGACKRILGKSQTSVPTVLTCNKTVNPNTLGPVCEINANDHQCTSSDIIVTNSRSIPVPAFLLNAKATRSEQKPSLMANIIESGRSNLKSSAVCSKDLFTIDDDLDDDWWNV